MSAPERLITHDPVSPAGDGRHGDLFGGPVPDARPATPPGPAPLDYAAIQDSPEFRELRRRTLRFTVPATLLFMGNYLLFVLLSAYAPEAMATPAIGLVNVGMLIGMFQFVSTVAIVGAYGRFARRNTDPLADRLRDEAESP